MYPEANVHESIVNYIGNVLQVECGADHGWLKRVWRLLSKAPEKIIFPNTMGASDFFDPTQNYHDMEDDDYAEIVQHIPADMNIFIGNCMLKLREAIIAENSNGLEPWTIQLQPDNNEETNVLAYFLSILYFLFTVDEDEISRVVRAFTLLTMLVRLWRKSLPSACITAPLDLDQLAPPVSTYNGEATLPDGYQAIHNLFIFAMNIIQQSPVYIRGLTNDVLYDINVIVRMPVSFTLGVHVTKLCSAIALQSKMTLGDDFDTSDVKATKIDLAFSWLYHLLLNTPANLHETVGDNVGAALSIFVHLFENNPDVTSDQNSINRDNVVKFCIKINPHIMYSHWFKKVLGTLGHHYSRHKEFSKILIQLPATISWGVIRNMMQVEKNVIEISETCGNYLICLNSTPTQYNSQNEADEAKRLKSQLLYYAFYPFAKNKIDPLILPRHLQVIYDLVSQRRKQFFKDITNFTYNDVVVTSLMREPVNVAYMMSNHMNMNWRHAPTNQLIINIWCKFVTLSNELGPRNFKAVALLIENSSASDLHPCVNNLTRIIPYIIQGGLNASVVIRIINTFLRHALDPGSMSHIYVRALFKAIFDENMAEHRRPVAYTVARCVCNNNTSSSLFKMFRELHLLTDEIVASIVNNYVTHNQPVAWNLLHRTLLHVEYTEIPQYMTNMLRSFLDMQILCSGFDAETQLAFFGSMLSIVRYRRARHLIGQGDAEFFDLLSTYLQQCFDTNHSTSQVQFLYLDLVSELRTFMPRLEEWIPKHFELSEKAIVRYLNEHEYYIISATRLAIFREVAKSFGDMSIRLKLTASEELIKLIAARIKDTTIREMPSAMLTRYATNWSSLALLFGKVCIHRADYIAIYIDAMNHILRHGRDLQKSLIIEAMSDICRIHIENLGIIMPYLMEYLAHRSSLQVSACESLLNLLKTGNMRLKRTEYLMLISLISSEESTLRDVFMKLFEENLLPNNSDLILTNFIPMMLYFHKVFNHPDYVFDADEREKMDNLPGIIENVCSTYTTLIKYVKTGDKFQLMLKVATDIISVLHNRRLAHSDKSVRMLVDAYKVIYVVTKTIDNKYDVPNEAVQMYKETFQRMESMEKQSAYLFMNYDTPIKDVLVILLAILEDIHTIHPSMFQDTFHLIMFVISTFYANVCSLVVSLHDTPFPGSVKALPVLYDRYKESFTTYGADIFKF